MRRYETEHQKPPIPRSQTDLLTQDNVSGAGFSRSPLRISNGNAEWDARRKGQARRAPQEDWVRMPKIGTQ